MAASEEPSHFTVHIFLSHDPMISRALLPELFFDFPDSAWKLAPSIKMPPRSREMPKLKDLVWQSPRKVLGRYVLSEPVAGDTTFLQLSEKVEQELAIAKRYQGQFTIFPQYVSEEGQYPLWHDRPLPWDMTLAEVRLLDLDSLRPGSDGSSIEIAKDYAPVLHLVLETKAAALMRIVGCAFLDEEIGDPYRFFRDMWNQYDSFWHSYGWKSHYSQLKSTLRAWRTAKFAYAYLTKQREKGRLGLENDELKTKIRRVDKIWAMKMRGGLSWAEEQKLDGELSNLIPRIRQIETKEANGREELRELSIFVAQWTDWIINMDFQNFAIQLMKQDEVEPKVMSVFRQMRQVIDDWKSSEGRQQLGVLVENDSYAARPWLTEEDRARSERKRLETLAERVNLRSSSQNMKIQ
ncbi:hypothetical protein MFIFM68171_00014 [Madurella fahalii]|uniref:Uncharacterized protein n=1 Tax=Madurella fahalii TaxID=1157608 RepID=A0ABQ0FWD9_9PEZI